jgi:RNA polymerase sigma-70 factor (ECF subfamily)
MLAVYLSILDTEQEKHKMSELYEANKAIMLRYAVKITQNQAMAEDAVHNAFLSVIKHKDKYLSLSNEDFLTRTIIIVKCKCIDIIRRNNSLAKFELDCEEHADDSQELPALEKIMASEAYERIRRQLDLLDEISKLVLEMKYLLGKTYKEIGDELDLTPKHVETRIRRAKSKVRKSLKNEGEAYE